MNTYQIALLKPEAHIFEVVMTIPLNGMDNQLPLFFKLPSWIPGSYMIRDFARHIINIRAELDSVYSDITQVDKHTWRVDKKIGSKELKLIYQVYAFDLSVRGCFFDKQRAFLNPAAVCLVLEGAKKHSCQIAIEQPKQEYGKKWHLKTPLEAGKINKYGFGTYVANDYAELIDSPIEIGLLTCFDFDVEGVKHEFILSGTFDADLERLQKDVQKICAAQVKMFNGLMPFKHYQFMLHVSDDVYGGLEHRASTALLASRDWLPYKGMGKESEEYIQLLGLISHEYFHAWNVKSIKPELFLNYGLDKEVYTEQLWAFEGITSYYDDLFLLKSGIVDKETYLDMVAKNITKVYRGSGRTKQTLADSSFNAWTKFYKQDENSPNAIVSYYQKGALFALGLDLLIRKKSNDQKSLDDVMCFLYQEYGHIGKGIPEKKWQEIAQKILGMDLSSYFQYLYSTEDLPLSELFNEHGIDYHWVVEDTRNFGGYSVQAPKSQENVVNLGIKYQTLPLGLKVTHVLDDGAAQKAGVSVGDELIAINGLKITDLNKQLLQLSKDHPFSLQLFRHGVLEVMTVEWVFAQENTCFLSANNLAEIKWLNETNK